MWSDCVAGQSVLSTLPQSSAGDCCEPGTGGGRGEEQRRGGGGEEEGEYIEEERGEG